MNNRNAKIENVLDEALELFDKGESTLEITKKYLDFKNEITEIFESVGLVCGLRLDIEIPESGLTKILNSLPTQEKTQLEKNIKVLL